MRVSRLLLGVAVVTGFGVSSSAQAAGGMQNVNIQVRGASAAHCTFRNDTVNEQGQFPGELKIARSKADLQADCTGEGNKRVTFVVPASIEKANALSGITNSVLPATAYDPATGGVYAYPQTVTVDFREIGETSAVESDALAPATGDTQSVTISSENGAATAHTSQGEATATPHMQPIVESSGVKVASATTTTTTTSSRMKPVASPEDNMGAEPGKVKAAARAKAEAAKKAKEAAAEKKRQAAADAAAAKAAAAEAKAAAEAAASAPAPAATEPAATTTTTTTTTTAPVAPVPSTDTPPAEPVAPATTTTTTTTGAPTSITPAGKTDMDKYLEGQ